MEILPIPELVAEIEPKTLSYIIMDLRNKRLAGIRKDTFEELLKSADIPCRYFCRRSFAIWDVLLPSEELVKKLAGSNVTTKNFRLQPEYKGTRLIRVTVCSVPVQLNGDVIAAYMSANGNVKEIIMVCSADGTAHDDFVLNICLNKEGFQAISYILTYQNQQVMVVVEGRRPLKWSCKQQGHFARICPQKWLNNNQTSSNISNNSSNQEKTISPTTNPAPKPGNHPKPEAEWTQVTGKGKRTIE